MNNKTKKLLTLVVGEDTKRKLKAKCAEQGLEMSELVRDLIEKWLLEQNSKTNKTKVG